MVSFMGMVPILIVAAAEKRRRDERAAAARRRTEEQRKKKDASKYSYSNSGKKADDRPYVESVLKEIAYYNPELLEFFKGLEEARKDALEERCVDITKSIRECVELLIKYNEQLKLTKQKLMESGVKVEGSRAVMILCSEAREKGFEHVDDEVTFNGLTLSSEMVSNPDDEKYKSEYDVIRKENVPLQDKEKHLRAELDVKRRKLSRAILSRTKKSLASDIKEIEERLSLIERSKKAEKIAEKRKDIFESLTPEQRRMIGQYISINEQFRKLVSLISVHSMKREGIRREKVTKGTTLRAFEILCERNHMTQEDIGRIFDELDRIAIRRNRREYDFSIWSTDKDLVVESYKPIIQGFITHIYEADSQFLEHNAWEISSERQDEQEY